MRLIALALLLCCGGKPPAPAPAPQKSQAPATTPAPAQVKLAVPEAGRLYHGVLPAGVEAPETDVAESTLDTYEQTAGRKVAYVYFSDEWMVSRAFPQSTVAWIRARGATPFVRLMLRSQRVPLVTDPLFTLDRIIAGEFDGDLQRWADAASAQGPLIVEYGTEINGDWNPWSAPYNGGLDIGPGKFKTAYRHIVTLMRARAGNITWALHYNSQNFPQDPRNVPAAYYPGDDVVDWVGISAYGSERVGDGRCPAFRSLVDTSLPELRAATAQKPFFIFEFGNTFTNTDCPAAPWVQAALADLLGGRWPELRGFSWWDQRWNDARSGGAETDMLLEDDPAVSAEFRSALAAPAVVDAPIFK